MAEVEPAIQVSSPGRMFKGHGGTIRAAVVFPDGRRMVTGSHDKTLRMWDLKDGTMLKEMKGHRDWVIAVAVSSDGKLIASGDFKGELLAWDGDTSESLTDPIKGHFDRISSLDFSPDSAVLATVSFDETIKFWRTGIWDVQGGSINCGERVYCVRYSPSGELVAFATDKYIQIWSPGGPECIAKLKPEGISPWASNVSLTWTPNGARLFSAGNRCDPTIREWDTSTWQQVEHPWSGHTDGIHALTIGSSGTLLASASHDSHVRLWRLSDQQTIFVFSHSCSVCCCTFSTDGKYVLCGDGNANITECGVPEDAFPEDTPDEQDSDSDIRDPDSEILSINPIVRNACVMRDFCAAQKLLTQQISLDENNHNTYANRSLLYARTRDWDSALRDARKSISIQPSLTGYISKGIALCGTAELKEAMKAFDIAFMFTGDNSNTIHLLLLIKAIALFNANEHEDAMLRIRELASACPNADTRACRLVEAYLLVQLGLAALNDARHTDASNHFTTAINTGILSCNPAIHPKCEAFVVLFGWDLASSWQTANQNLCCALLLADKLSEAHEAFKYMMNMCDEATKVGCRIWSSDFKRRCHTLYVASGDAALAASAHDRAIELYSSAIKLGRETDTVLANRCKAKLGKSLWEEALVDAQKVIRLNPSSFLGYHLKHAALHGAQRYDEAIEALQFNLLKLDGVDDPAKQVYMKEYSEFYVASGDAALVVNAYDRAIQLYSVAIDLDPGLDTVYVNRCKAKLGQTLWEEAVMDAQKVTELNPSSFIGYHLKHAALHGAKRYDEAIEVLQLNLLKLTDAHDPNVQTFKKEYAILYVASGDAALVASIHDRAIQLYSVAIDLDPAVGTVFANRCRARLEKTLWDEALFDAEKVIELDPSSYLGYDLKHAAFHGAQRYDEAIEIIQLMLDAHDPELQAMRQEYVSISEAQCAIQKAIDIQMENTPPRLFNTSTGHLCDKKAQIVCFQESTECKELLSSIMKRSSLQPERIQDVVSTFFQYVMLSHRWEGKEPSLRDIEAKNVYELNPVDGIRKLQSFCKVARDQGHHWTWSDTCCIDKTTIIELQQSINSMFVWYRRSVLTIIYLSDVPPSSKSGALAKSIWNSRGWTVQEFLAPKVVLFYQEDWTLYLDDHSPNHKESPAIIQELAAATGINVQTLVSFRPEMRGAREKLRWSSRRETTVPEDIAYSLFGVFGVQSYPNYGENKQNALGRLLQEIIAQCGDISCLDWTGQPSEFNSCLPASITSYAAPPFMPPSLSEDEMETLVTSPSVPVELAPQLHDKLYNLAAPRFAQRRLHLPCIVFPVRRVAARPNDRQDIFTYSITTNGLRDLLITTVDKFWRKPSNKHRQLLLVRPWDHHLLELPDFTTTELYNLADDAQDITEDFTPPTSPLEHDVDSDSQALRLVAHLGQPFRALLLAQRGKEYSRIAADYSITAQVKDISCVLSSDVRILEIL